MVSPSEAYAVVMDFVAWARVVYDTLCAQYAKRTEWIVILIVALSVRALKRSGVPKLGVKLTEEEEHGIEGKFWDANAPFPKDSVPCYDPGNMKILGPNLPAMRAEEVRERIERAAVAQKEWAKSSFATRRKLLRVIQRFILDEQDTICQVSARDSGKPLVDAAFGEVLVTLEKIRWLCNEGEKWLKPEYRSSGAMMFYKQARVEYHPVGVMGAIVPWNYPFHNVFNPLVANLFAGNALVVKVSEYASWSSQYYGRVIEAALAAVGAPKDLVQIITGYGEAGNALVTGGVQKLVFVGSTGIGRKVMEAAAKTLTPVVLELGGKDPFVVCADADLNQCVPMALRGAFQSCGQNCAGAERFYVHEKIHDKFLSRVLEAATKLRQGWALSSSVDCGAMCMPKQALYVQSLIDDAVAKGATVHVGGKSSWARKVVNSTRLPSSLASRTTCASPEKKSSVRCSPSSRRRATRNRSRSRTIATLVSVRTSSRVLRVAPNNSVRSSKLV